MVCYKTKRQKTVLKGSYFFFPFFLWQTNLKIMLDLKKNCHI